MFEPELEHTDLVTIPQTISAQTPRRFGWLGLLLSALLSLFTMWAALSIVQLVQDFFALSPWLGWLAFAIAGLAGLAALAIIAKEITGLWRLRKIEQTPVPALYRHTLHLRQQIGP